MLFNMRITDIVKISNWNDDIRLDGKPATQYSTPGHPVPLAGPLTYNTAKAPVDPTIKSNLNPLNWMHNGYTALGNWSVSKPEDSFVPHVQPTQALHQRMVNQGVTQGSGLLGNAVSAVKNIPGASGVVATVADNVIPHTQWAQDHPLLSKALTDSGIMHNKGISDVVSYDPQGNPVVNTEKALDYAKEHTGDLMGNVANAAKGAWGSLSPDWQTGLKWGGGGLLGALALSSIFGAKKQQQQPININVGGSGPPGYHGYQSFEKSSGMTETLLGMAIGNGMKPNSAAPIGKPIDTAAKEYHPNFSTTDPQVWKALQSVTAKKKLEDLILQAQNGVI